MNICQNKKCKGKAKLYLVSAKCSDLYTHVHLNTDNVYEGYVPDWLSHEGYGDYVNFIVCRHCGQLQGNWPINSRKKADKFKSGKALIK